MALLNLRRRLALLVCPELLSVQQVLAVDAPAISEPSEPAAKTASDTIKRIAEIYAGHLGLKLSTLGVYVMNDGKFFARLASGGDCRSRTVTRVVQWFADHWPSDLEWPRDVPRPAATVRRAA